MGGSPREIAQRIKDQLDSESVPHLAKVEIAGPGFLNLFLAPSWLHDVLREVVAGGEGYGRSDALAGRRINLEFVSANPTGPLHAGGGRWVAVGDAIANLLAAQGAEVHREYYLNDAGTQLDMFRDSLYARYRGPEPARGRLPGRSTSSTWPSSCTPSSATTSRPTKRASGATPRSCRACATTSAASACISTRGSPSAPCTSGVTSPTCSSSSTPRVVYDKDGARWLRSTDFGDQRDRVLVRSDGSTTYLCNDLAYHRDKFRRGFTHLIDIWGADHHGQVKSLQAGMEALGFAAGEPEIILGQFVKVVKDGAEVRMSKRTGNIVTLADILDEVDPDVARMTFLLQGIDTAQTFDLDVVTEQSRENPVYYVQYAHARIASIGRKAEAAGVARVPLEEVDLLAAGARARGRAAARARELSRRAARSGRDPGAAEGQHVGPRLRVGVPRLLPRLQGAVRRCRAHPGPAVAHRGVPGRAGERARSARRERSRRDDSPRPRRHRRCVGEVGVRAVTTFDLSLLPVSATTDADGRVAIAGVDLASLAEEFGTPLFVYDEDDIRQRCRAYRAALGDGVAYASKAFLCTAMARLVHEEGLHLDVATGGELFVALNAGFPAERIVFHGNNKSTAELRRALEAGVGRIAVDSADELEPARGVGRRRTPRAPRAHPGDAGCRGAHARVHRDGHRGLEVRLRPRQR